MAAPVRGGNTCTIFVIDVSPTLARKHNITEGCGEDARTREMTSLECGLEYVKSKVGAMLLAGLKTVHCGVVLFGTEVTDNTLAGATQGYDFLWEYIPPGQPDSTTLMKLDAVSEFQTYDSEEDKGDAMTAIILALHVLDLRIGNKKIARKVIVVTDGESVTDWDDLESTIEKMNKDNVELTVVGVDFDDEEYGLKEENKSETKKENEKMYHHIAGLLYAPSIVGPLALALPDVLSPTPKTTVSRPTPMQLTLGFPGSDEEAKELGFDPECILKINVILKKCTTSVRPMIMQNMSKAGLKVEEAKRRVQAKSIKEFVDERLGRSTKKAVGNGEEEDEKMEDADKELIDSMTGMINVVKNYVYSNTRGVHQGYDDKMDVSTQKSQSQANKRKRQTRADMESSDEEDDDRQGNNGKDDKADGSDQEDKPLELVADPTRLQKVYRYGTDKVPLDDVDAAELKLQFSPCLEILGFVTTAEIPRHHLLNDVSYLFANPDQTVAQLAMSALIHAMVELAEPKSILCRYVGVHKSAEPKMVVLIPEMSGGIQFCWLIQVPFAEDIREYSFPSLEHAHSSKEKESKPHKNVPTEEMVNVMDQLVKDMELFDEDRAEDDEPLLDFESAYSPSVHHLKNCVLYRLAHPTSQGLPPVHSALSRYLQPHPIIQDRSSATVTKAIETFNIQKAVAKSKASNRSGASRDNAADDSGAIDIDAILGGSQPALEKEDMDVTKSEDTRADTGDDQAEGAKRRKTTDNGSEALIGLKDPVNDFRKVVDDPDIDRVHEAVSAMCEVALELVKSSFSTSKFSKATQCLQEVRETARSQDEVDTYNTFINRFKGTLKDPSFKNKDFWGQITQNRLGLITAAESEGEDGVTEAEAEQFYSV